MVVGIAGAGSSSRLPRLLAHPLASAVILLGLKLTILLGPTMTPGSAVYTAYADQTPTGNFLPVDLAARAIPIALARPIGWPAIVAAAKAIAGANWAWTVVLLQFAASIWATGITYRLVSVGLWCAYLVCARPYAAVHVEPRYLCPLWRDRPLAVW